MDIVGNGVIRRIQNVTSTPLNELDLNSFLSSSENDENLGFINSIAVNSGNFKNQGSIINLLIKNGLAENLRHIEYVYLENGQFANYGSINHLYIKQGKFHNFGTVENLHKVSAENPNALVPPPSPNISNSSSAIHPSTSDHSNVVERVPTPVYEDGSDIEEEEEDFGWDLGSEDIEEHFGMDLDQTDDFEEDFGWDFEEDLDRSDDDERRSIHSNEGENALEFDFSDDDAKIPETDVNQPSQSATMVGLARSSLNDSNGTHCPICFRSAKNHEAVSTQCGHIFCTKCITITLLSSVEKKCPMCKMELKGENPFHRIFL